MSFYITKHISNQMIKNYEYLTFFIWIEFFNIFINTITFEYSIETLESFKYDNPVFFCLIIKN